MRLVKKHLRGGKAGHAGTLDPFADGVLLVCTGRETRTITGLVDAEKEYQARLRLGMETDTLDISGTICARREWRLQEVAAVQEIADRFVGEIEQVPPVFSALHVDGQRSYKLARAGQLKSPEPRRVTVFSLKVARVSENSLDFTVVCSKGTYIRALARDLALALGTVGFLSRLTRTRIGPHTLQEAIEVTALPQMFNMNSLEHLYSCR